MKISRIRLAVVALALGLGLAPVPRAAGAEAAGFPAVAGEWQGTVSEMGLRRYAVRLALAPDGTGRAEYPDFPCATRLVPAGGVGIVLTETVVEGHAHCADGTVELTPDGEALRWLWRDATGAVRAAARLLPAE